MKWYLKSLKKYADFSGRAQRKEFWMFALFNYIFLMILIMISSLLFGVQETTPGNAPSNPFSIIIVILYGLFILIPSLAVTVRRLHDINKSGWWILISLVPMIGFIWFLVLLCIDGTVGDNQYGTDPKNRSVENDPVPENMAVFAVSENGIVYNVQHRYVCEHCGELSEWVTSPVNGKSIDDMLKKQIPEMQKRVNSGSYIDFIKLDNTCPKCGKHQSWGLKGAKSFMIKSPLIGLGVAGSLGWVVWFLFGLLGFLIAFVAGMLFFLIFGFVSYIKVVFDMKKTSNRNIPEIKWE
ncbi:MAG: DUF805 domain-containing protein [Prevotellaceae bacterium]|jgi:uncharacterized membrane protein YhaH (DUF805 family)|nr:DUF805 domain-containing protein [Prevotellaceae bacterium]